MSESVITRKGQVTIPKAIRDRLNAREGRRVRFVVRGDEVVLRLDEGTVLDLRGSVKGPGRTQDSDAIRAAVRRAVGKRVAGGG